MSLLLRFISRGKKKETPHFSPSNVPLRQKGKTFKGYFGKKYLIFSFQKFTQWTLYIEKHVEQKYAQLTSQVQGGQLPRMSCFPG